MRAKIIRTEFAPRAGAARRIALARFFAENLAVQASGLERAVTAVTADRLAAAALAE